MVKSIAAFLKDLDSIPNIISNCSPRGSNVLFLSTWKGQTYMQEKYLSTQNK